MSFDLFTLAILIASLTAGLVAAVSGFGIGSLLTPVLALQVDTRLAIAAVSIPHLVGTAQRFWTMRRNVDRRLLIQFGITSAAGGLIGALLHSRVSSRGLNVIFGCLLLFTAAAELTGWMRRAMANACGRYGRSRRGHSNRHTNPSNTSTDDVPAQRRDSASCPGRFHAGNLAADREVVSLHRQVA